MRPHWFIPCVLVMLIAGGLLASPSQAAGVVPAVTADRAGLLAGVTADWWADVRDSLQQARTAQDEQPSSVERALSFSWTAESDQKGAQMGSSVAGAGDVNGDGYHDVIVGAPAYDNGQTN